MFSGGQKSRRQSFNIQGCLLLLLAFDFWSKPNDAQFYSWLCTQSLFLVVFQESYGIPGHIDHIAPSQPHTKHGWNKKK